MIIATRLQLAVRARGRGACSRRRASGLLLTGSLAITLHAEGREGEARTAAEPLCAAKGRDLARLKALLRKWSLCDPPR